MECTILEPTADTPMTAESVSQYLDILQVPKRRPSHTALEELVAAHLTRVPFENISMLHRFKRLGLKGIPPLDLFLDGIVRENFGGMCFSSNIHFSHLLGSLGYDARLCGADMHVPNSHMATIVTIEGREYLVDVGYGAPFSMPMPLDRATDFRIELDHAFYRLLPRDARGQSRMEFIQNGVLRSSYVVKPQAMKAADFSSVIAAMFAPRAVFRNLLLLTRFWASGRYRIIHNLTVFESDGAFRAFPLANRNELLECIEESFGISPGIAAELVDDVGIG